MSHSRAWKRFIDTDGAVAPEKFAAFSRFDARYGVATSLTAIDFKGMSKATQDAYTSAVRVALAYSALESLGVATRGKGKLGASVVSADIAKRFRSERCVALRKLLTSEAESPVLRDQLRALAKDGDDVTPFATAVRHLTLHGPLTASGAGLAQSAYVRRLFADLAAAILQSADDSFEYFLDDNAIGPWGTPRLATCPSCGVPIGAKHVRGCTVARCKFHGEQWYCCLQPGKHAATKYRGVYPGSIEALKRGWLAEVDGIKAPNLIRVTTELKWNPATEMFE